MDSGSLFLDSGSVKGSGESIRRFRKSESRFREQILRLGGCESLPADAKRLSTQHSALSTFNFPRTQHCDAAHFRLVPQQTYIAV